MYTPRFYTQKGCIHIRHMQTESMGKTWPKVTCLRMLYIHQVCIHTYGSIHTMKVLNTKQDCIFAVAVSCVRGKVTEGVIIQSFLL